MSPTSQRDRLLKIDTPLGEDVLLLESFGATEGISTLFRIDAEVLAEHDKASRVTAAALIGQKVTITVQLPDGQKRYFHGIVRRLALQGRGSGERFTLFHLEIVPSVYRLTAMTNCRIFQSKTVPEILKKILDDAGIESRMALRGSYTKRDYCVQYRETDFQFLSRLMEHEGIFYFFEHKENKHTMVLADRPSSHEPCPAQSSARYVSEGGTGENEDGVFGWSMSEELQSGAWTMRDYNFQLPGKSLESAERTTISIGGIDKLELYDYPGEYAKLFVEPDSRLGEVELEGDKITRVRMEQEEVSYKVAQGHSDVRTFASGYKFDLTHHFQSSFNDTYVLTSVTHAAQQSPSYVSEEEMHEPYRNTFTCIPHRVPFRPRRVTPKPLVRGPHTAVVTGKPGEEIWPDKYGRVKVQFHWDREGRKDENSSCWIRVGQAWAGKNWGFIAIPRVGQEVIVHFLEGDPDQPIIVGSVYNADQMPPYTLPGNKTQTGIKSRSSIGGGTSNFNEIRFEDKKGSEEVYIHAEKDLKTIVEHDESLEVGNDRTTEIKNNETRTIKNERKTEVQNNDTLSVTNKLAMDAMEVTVDGTTKIVLKCGGSTIEMTPASIDIKTGGILTIQGSLVKIN
jgi:type VI secretion system secreted protein VgrG